MLEWWDRWRSSSHRLNSFKIQLFQSECGRMTVFAAFCAEAIVNVLVGIMFDPMDRGYAEAWSHVLNHIITLNS